MFLDPRAKRFHPDWGIVANNFAAMLRLEVGRNPGDRKLASLVQELLDASPEFRSRWERADVRRSQTGTEKCYRHPIVGELCLTIDSMEINTDGRPILWAATAEPGSPSEEVLAQLAEWAASSPS